MKDIEKAVATPNATKDAEGRLRVAAATTVGDAGFARSEALIDAGCDCIVIDTAHGHNTEVAAAVERVKTLSNSVQIVAGNVATGDAAKALIGCGRGCGQGRHRARLDLHDPDRCGCRRAAAHRDHGRCQRGQSAFRSLPTAASAPAATSPRRSRQVRRR